MQIKQVLRVCVAVLLPLVGCAGKDIKKLCPIAESVEKDSSIPETEKTDEFTRKALAAVSSDDVKGTLKAVCTAPPEHRYAIMQQAAKELGTDGWSCDAFEHIAGVEGSGTACP